MSGFAYRTNPISPSLTPARAQGGRGDEAPRRLHDARHAALTGMAANGSSPVAIQHVAGHASMATTQKYLHLAGTVFREDAERLEARQLSTGLSAPQRTSHDPSGSGRAWMPENITLY